MRISSVISSVWVSLITSFSFLFWGSNTFFASYKSSVGEPILSKWEGFGLILCLNKQFCYLTILQGIVQFPYLWLFSIYYESIISLQRCQLCDMFLPWRSLGCSKRTFKFVNNILISKNQNSYYRKNIKWILH